ncbi:MAG: ankyrin repeat domain-containing protein, partial [Leptospiraceae bacterium]|nr:ankyrin repeat domain-containing protein [Leptospiraceae bacterium]
IKYLKGDSEKIKNNLTGFIRIGNKKYLEELLESGIDLNYSEKSRYPPLHTAILLGNYEIVKLLLNKKADPKFKNYRGKTGIDLAEEKLKKSKLASKKIEYQKILDLLKQYSK